MKPALIEALEKLVAWVQTGMLPLWKEKALQVPVGWACERLDTNGDPDLERPIRLVAQAQFVYLFARAEQLGWLAGILPAIRQVTDFVSRYGTLPCRSDGYVRALNHDLSILDDGHSLIDHAYFMASSAAAFSAFGESSNIRRAYNIYDWLELRLAQPAGGWFEDAERCVPGRARSHLQMLLTFLYLYEVSQKSVWFNRAGAAVQLYEQRGVASGAGDDSSYPDASSEDSFLWIYGLQKYARCAGDALGPKSLDLYHHASACEGGGLEERSTAYLATKMLAGLPMAGDPDVADDLVCLVDLFFQLRAGQVVVGGFKDQAGEGVAASYGSVGTALLLFEVAREATTLLQFGSRHWPRSAG